MKIINNKLPGPFSSIGRALDFPGSNPDSCDRMEITSVTLGAQCCRGCIVIALRPGDFYFFLIWEYANKSPCNQTILYVSKLVISITLI